MSKVPLKPLAKNHAETKPPLLGPATVAMILGLISIAGWKVLVPPKVTIERRVAASDQSHFERPVPLSQLLSWAADLDLSESQLQSLARLSDEQRAKLVPLMNEIERAVTQFSDFAAQHKRNGANLTDLQNRGGRMSVLSAQKREMEQSFDKAGLALLTGQQQEKAKALWRNKQGPLKRTQNEVAGP